MTRMFRKSMIASLGALALAGLFSEASFAQPRGTERNSDQVRTTAIPGQHRYTDMADAVLAADLDHVITQARASVAKDSLSAAEATVLIMDDLAAGRTADASTALEALPDRYREGVRKLLESWISLRNGDATTAKAQAGLSAETLPGRLGSIQLGLLSESSGDLRSAEKIYDKLTATLDKEPPREDEPASIEEAFGNLLAPQTTQILYRAALVKHRLGKKDEARAAYALVEAFAPNSPDTALNIKRLEHGEAPMEPALDYARGLARWSLFISEEFGRSEGLAQLMTDPTRREGLVSPSSALFAQMGVALDSTAADWAIGSGYTLLQADGLDGAERIFRRIDPASVYGPDAAIGLAEIALKRKKDDRAVQEAQRAMRLAPERWTVAVASASILTRAGREKAAIDAYSDALARAVKPRDRANILIARASAQNFFGHADRAVEDGHAAVAADGRTSIKIALIGLLMESENGWDEAVQVGRQLLAEKPDSVARLNQLGYTLIQRPNGLEEGFRLLTRGVELGDTDYAVIDSLGWAYYLYGDFDQARLLIERANELSPEPVSEILDHLGDIAWRQGKQDEARAAWRRALDAQPEAKRRASLTAKLEKGLTTPAPEPRKPPTIDPVKPGQRSDT